MKNIVTAFFLDFLVTIDTLGLKFYIKLFIIEFEKL